MVGSAHPTILQADCFRSERIKDRNREAQSDGEGYLLVTSVTTVFQKITK